MHRRVISLLECPACRGALEVRDPVDGSEETPIESGVLKCSACESEYPIEGHIPRFVNAKNYASSFGFEWRQHAKTQLDKFNGTTISKERLFRETGWPTDLAGQRVLEVGCGSGRFTEVALGTGAEVFSIDYSDAVDVSFENNRPNSRLTLAQADLYALPFKPGTFDKIFCIGVIQHTPRVKEAFRGLLPYLKEGGEIVVDVYAKSWESYFTPKYWMRAITKRLPKGFLYAAVTRITPFLLPIKVQLRKHIPVVGRYVAGIVPVANFSGMYPLSRRQLLEWSILDTFDDLSPRYDSPQRIYDVRGWFDESPLTDVLVDIVPPGIIRGRGIKAARRHVEKRVLTRA